MVAESRVKPGGNVKNVNPRREGRERRRRRTFVGCMKHKINGLETKSKNTNTRLPQNSN
jgi:hypothetical protein